MKPKHQNVIVCLSIKNRIKDLRELIPQINSLHQKMSNTNYRLSVNITDFKSDDCDISQEIMSLICPYLLTVIDEPFNLGKGWNTSANNMNINDDDILLFLTNDIYIPNMDLFFTDVMKYTIKNTSVYSPEHASEDKYHNRHFHLIKNNLFHFFLSLLIFVQFFFHNLE